MVKDVQLVVLVYHHVMLLQTPPSRIAKRPTLIVELVAAVKQERRRCILTMSYRDEEKAPAAADSGAQVGTYDHLVQGSAGAQYWEKVDADINGMLGGFSSVSAIDLQGSRTFLARFGIGTKGGRKSVTSVVDAGAG